MFRIWYGEWVWKNRKIGNKCGKYRNICENRCKREFERRTKKFDREKERNVGKENRHEVKNLRKYIRLLIKQANEQLKISKEYKNIKDEKNFIKHDRIYKKILKEIHNLENRADSLKL